MIAALKKHYRRIVLSRLVTDDFPDTKSFLKTLNMWTVANDLASAWTYVKESTIVSGWSPLNNKNEEIIEEFVDFSQFHSSFTQEEIEAWIHIDDSDPGFQIFTDEEIIDLINEDKDPLNLSDVEDDLSESVTEQNQIVTVPSKEVVLDSIENVKSYCQYINENQFNPLLVQFENLKLHVLQLSN